ncbi:MAG: polyphenol oxidase family protein [Deltaproteobacteria bacterium]|jgi:YfiH family protein|nr:polyphenol oxidase family protein [Deltaproteobacteria bacterium]
MDKVKFYPAVLPFKFPGLDRVRCAFSTALYGNISLDFGLDAEADKERRRKLAVLLGFDSWTELRQVHGPKLLVNPPATPFDAPSTLEADGCCTDRPGQAMLAKAADCQQILLAHKSGRFVAALHAGWRGNAIKFPESGVADFCAACKIKPEDVLAVRGPSLGPGSAEFVNFDQEWPAEFSPWFDREKKLMDLWALTRRQLTAAGLRPENIYSLDFCTYAQNDVFFSYRAGNAGRQAGLIFIANR